MNDNVIVFNGGFPDGWEVPPATIRTFIGLRHMENVTYMGNGGVCVIRVGQTLTAEDVKGILGD